MSAQQDKSHKIKFVYSNLYQIYNDKKEVAAHAVKKSVVLKAGDLNSKESAHIQVKDYFAPSITGTIIARPDSLPGSASSISPQKPANKTLEAQPVGESALLLMKRNLQILNDLQARLRFVLKELEELAD